MIVERFLGWLSGRRNHRAQTERLREAEAQEKEKLQQVVTEAAHAAATADRARVRAQVTADRLTGQPTEDPGRRVLLTAERALRLIEEEHDK